MKLRTRTALFALLALGCAPRVGSDCPPAADMLAHTLVHRRDGLPAYAGQALMITSCGGGAFCHSEGATERYGAPYGLDFDVELADQVSDTVHGAARLRHAQVNIFDHRDDIWGSVVGGTMPPGAAGHMVQQQPYVTFDGAGVATPIAGLDTPAGRETLRNWLACNAPVVERTFGLDSGTQCTFDSDCPLTGICQLATRTCLRVGPTEPYQVVPISPTWASIYDVVISSRCTQGSCHGAGNPAAGLDLSDRTHARTVLMTASASAHSDCAGHGPYITMGDPAHSLLYTKLAITDSTDPAYCGVPMPKGSAVLAPRYVTAIHDWIMAGAPP